MSSTTFVSGTTIASAWLNDVNAITYLYPTTQVFVATAGQTVYTLSSSSTTLMITQVFLNGLRLIPTTDYSVSGTVVTLTTGATLADELLIDYFHA